MILVTGATGFLGKRVTRLLSLSGKSFIKSSLSLGVDFRDYQQTIDLFKKHKFTKVINCAAYVGGIQFGLTRQADIFHNNLLMTLNILKAMKETKVRRLVNPISNCAYPANATYFKEKNFWDGALHESVMVYGMCRKVSWMGSYAYQRQHGLDSINIVLSNMYGPGDHFDEEKSHALGAIIMKMVDAKVNNRPTLSIWGSGDPLREWLYIDDGAEAMIRGLEMKPFTDIINIGLGTGITISDLAKKIKEMVGYNGNLIFDRSKPDGAPFKIVDGSKGAKLLGWKPSESLDTGLKKTIDWYLKNGKDLLLGTHENTGILISDNKILDKSFKTNSANSP